MALHELTDQELNDRIFTDLDDSIISTDPESVMIALESPSTPSARREALQQLYFKGGKQ